ncbi:MAG: ferrous iron transport protein B [Nitrospiraceae bacterium]|nr:MAG: ferrous iron transport protein B [Nitrospiraceae bacterium]
MHDHSIKQKDTESDSPSICLVGNPNVGKSAIFGLLTGRYVTVSNYPGTTVEITRGEAYIHKKKYQIIDTPGVNSLVPMSEDEKVTRDILLQKKSDTVVHVADSKNMKRSLFITIQLIEMGLPLVIDLNMRDEASSRGIDIDEDALSEIFGLDVVSTIAVQKKGINTLKKIAVKPGISHYTFNYDDHIEEYISRIGPLLPESHISRRSVALMVLSGDRTLRGWLLDNLSKENIKLIESFVNDAAAKYSEPLSYVISQQRLKAVEAVAGRIIRKSAPQQKMLSGFFEKVTTHPAWGFPFLLVVLYIVYQFVGSFGAGTLVDFFEETIFGEYLNPWAEKIVTALIPVQFLQELLIGPYGVITMALTYAIAIILPITATFFIAFSIMEDSGYLPRLAAMLNKVFRIMGLNGKAVLPMVLGLGCDTMATLTTRILDTPKERLIVIILLALGVPCSAQLGVILGMFGKQPFSAVLIWAGTLVAVTVFVGFVSAKLIPGQRADFILELPPLRLPQFSNVLIKTLWRIEWYLKEAVPLFILGTLILFTADKLGLLPFAQKMASPVIVTVLGLPAEAAESFIMGFLRRDYGAAGLFNLQEQGLLNTEQVVVSLVTITLFIPCIANLFMIIKEKGMKVAMLTAAFIFPFSILVGGVLHRVLLMLKIFE